MMGYTPKIGDIVLYKKEETAEFLPAIVTRVWSEDTINLSIFNDYSGGESEPVKQRTSIVRFIEYEDGKTYYPHWFPKVQ